MNTTYQSFEALQWTRNLNDSKAIRLDQEAKSYDFTASMWEAKGDCPGAEDLRAQARRKRFEASEARHASEQAFKAWQNSWNVPQQN